MKKKIVPILIFICLCPNWILAQNRQKTIHVEIANHWEKAKTDEPIVLKINDLKINFKIKSASVWSNNTEIPSQLDDLNNDQAPDEIAFLVNLPARDKKKIKIIFSNKKSDKQYPSRVYAEMLLRGKKGKHMPIQSITTFGTSNIYSLLHHHGPAFESELVAYRIYFDKKQTVDLYGKFNKGFEIKESQFYPTDEQLARGFGDDVLRVGSSCGLGTLKGWNGEKATHIEPVKTRTERILAYGPIRTVVEVEVRDWKYQGSELNMINRYTLYGGHRDVLVETFFKEPLKQEIFCTGVEDIKGSVSFSDHKGLIGCWGRDWPVNDTIKYTKETVGLATCIPQKYIIDERKDKANYLYTIGKKGTKYFQYHITFTSMKETFGYKTSEEWFKYIQEWKEELKHPFSVKLQ